MEVAYPPEKMDYLNREKKNKREEAVRQYFHAQGFKSLSRGWPDFVFFKTVNGKLEAIFVEVKPPSGRTSKNHQDAIKQLLECHGCDVRVAFGVDEFGVPVFKKMDGRVTEDASDEYRQRKRRLGVWHNAA